MCIYKSEEEGKKKADNGTRIYSRTSKFLEFLSFQLRFSLGKTEKNKKYQWGPVELGYGSVCNLSTQLTTTYTTDNLIKKEQYINMR